MISAVAPETWLKAFLERRELSTPDGRPLFNYRVSSHEFGKLQAGLQGRLPRSRAESAAFCLYATEWWRRYGRGFKWEGLRESLNLSNAYTDLYEPLAAGFKFWKRELRVVRSSKGVDREWRDFVGTLSREAGFPLQLLHGEQTSVNRFFKSLLKEHYADGTMTPEVAEGAAHLLSDAWRHRDIYELAARLVSEIWDLRKLVRNADDPVAQLERIRPRWRESLPILVDSEDARVFVQSLVKEAHEIAVTHGSAFHVETTIQRTCDGWALRRTVDVPRRIRAPQVNELLRIQGEDPISRRLRLVLETEGEPIPLAVITQWTAGEPYAVENLAAASAEVKSISDIRLHAETREQAFGGHIMCGGEALEDAPWIFVPSSAQSEEMWKLVAQGSGKLRHTAALVVLPPEACVQSPGHVEQVGVLSVGKDTHPIVGVRAGILRVEHRGETYSVELASESEEAWSYRLVGERFDSPGLTDIWHGVPQLVAEAPSGCRRQHAPERLQWRPHGQRREWASMSPACAGDIELRYAETGVTQVIKRAKVVPRSTVLQIVPREGATRGGLRLGGTGAARANIVADDTFAVEAVEPADGFEWTFETRGDPPPSVEVALAWTHGGKLRVPTPYPVVGVRFLDHQGRPLGSTATIALENLSRSQVEAVLPATEAHPMLEIHVADCVDRSREFVRDSEACRPLRTRTRDHGAVLRRYTLDLHEVVEDVRLRIASSAEMNAHVRLVIKSASAKCAVLTVRRFAISMKLNEQRDAIIVLKEKSEEHIDDQLERMQLRRVPVAAPDDPPAVLTRRAPCEWSLDADGENSHTWLIAGYDGDACCGRPVIWMPQVADSTEEPHPGVTETISDAVEIRAHEQRKNALRGLLSRMVEDSRHPEWDRLLPYVGTLATLPATTFDLLDAIVHVPSSAVFALLEGQARVEFAKLWASFEDLSFSWETVPVRDWIRGTRIWWERRTQELLALSEAHVVVVREAFLSKFRRSADQIARRMPVFPLVRELVDAHVFGEAKPPNSMSMTQWAASVPGQQWFQNSREDALRDLLRAQANARWPAVGAIRSLRPLLDDSLPIHLVALQRFAGVVNHWQEDVVSAPVLAALASAWGITPQAEQIFAIRQLRVFDVNWFERCYQATLACAVGLILQNDGRYYA